MPTDAPGCNDANASLRGCLLKGTPTLLSLGLVLLLHQQYGASHHTRVLVGAPTGLCTSPIATCNQITQRFATDGELVHSWDGAEQSSTSKALAKRTASTFAVLLCSLWLARD